MAQHLRANPLVSGAGPTVAGPGARGAAHWAAPLALGVSMCLWGSTHPLIKLALHELGPSQMIFLRVLSAGLVLLAISVVSGRGPVLLAQARQPLSPIVQGLLGYFLTMSLSTYALQYVPAAVNALLINLSPIFTVLLSALLLGEALTWRAAVGVAVGFLGVGVVTLSGRQLGGLGPEAQPGVGIGLVAALVWAAYTVATRRLASRTLDPMAATTLAALGAAIPLGLVAGPASAATQVLAASAVTQVSVLWTGMLASGGTFVIWAWALSRMRAGQVAAFQYLVAPVALLLAWPILGEQPSLLLLVGMALVLAGVAATQKR
jgi:drug/metabolite transporter (DMT)-like permease